MVDGPAGTLSPQRPTADIHEAALPTSGRRHPCDPAPTLWDDVDVSRPTFGEVLAMPGVREECELRGRVGLMAYHGGGLEEMTDVVARRAAADAGASYYGVVHPPGFEVHVPSTQVVPDDSAMLAGFLDHVDTIVTVHGFGRRPLLTSLLLGGRNRDLAGHVAGHLREHLPAYDIVDDLDRIPVELRGVHARNPVNVTTGGGVQLELPPRVRGSSPLWWDWEHGLVPHTEALIAGLAAAVRTI